MNGRPNLANDEVYHVYNRGVAKQALFHDSQDYRHFLETISYYIESNPVTKLSMVSPEDKISILSREPIDPLVEVLAYCLMPNHFHLVLRQLQEDGISTFMRRALNSYTRAYNTRYHRVGPLFQGRFCALHVESDEQLLHLSRYIHLNPFVAKLSDATSTYQWSSLGSYYSVQSKRLCHTTFILSIVGDVEKYQNFVEDYAGYAQDLEVIKKLIKDEG